MRSSDVCTVRWLVCWVLAYDGLMELLLLCMLLVAVGVRCELKLASCPRCPETVQHNITIMDRISLITS